MQFEVRTFSPNKTFDSHPSHDISCITNAVWGCILFVRVLNQICDQEILAELCMVFKRLSNEQMVLRHPISAMPVQLTLHTLVESI